MSSRLYFGLYSVFVTVICLACGAASAQQPAYGDALYQPRLRQPGKDVIWLPTPDAMVLRMLEAAKVFIRSKDSSVS